MGRKPKNTTSVSPETPEQFELPNMPEKKDLESPLEIAVKSNIRDEKGLLPGINYILTDDGRKINWRKMVDPKYIVVWKEKFGPDVDTKSLDITELPDDKVLILLNGFKKLLKLRGAESVKYTVGQAHESFASVTCDISWISNFENREKTSSGCADAHYHNTNSFSKFYCSSIASNRALVRAVRDHLEIEILGFDEIGETPSEEENENSLIGALPHNSLESAAKNSKTLNDASKKKGMSLFEFVRWGYIETSENPEEKESAAKWESWSDIPRQTCFVLTTRIKRKDKEN